MVWVVLVLKSTNNSVLGKRPGLLWFQNTHLCISSKGSKSHLLLLFTIIITVYHYYVNVWWMCACVGCTHLCAHVQKLEENIGNPALSLSVLVP